MKTPEPIEIITDYVDENNYQHIDCYFTDDENEEGKTVAIVSLDTGKEFFIDNMYYSNKRVQAVILEIQKDLE
jgi:hypothetical protein